MKSKEYVVSKEIKARLSKAYMNLFNALVKAYQSNGKPLGQSQFNAISVMREIMLIHGKQEDTPAMLFLTKLFNTHKSIVAKKTMISQQKDTLEPINGDSNDVVNTAITRFEAEINQVNLDEKQSATDKQNILPIVLKQTSNLGDHRNFYDWVNATATQADIDRLEHDPAFFGKLYNKYIMRQKHK